MLKVSQKLTVPVVLFAIVLIMTGCKTQTQAPVFAPDPGVIPAQTFSVNAEKNEVVTGAAGSVFALPKGALRYPDGSPVKGEVQVVIKEAPDLATMLKSGMETVSAEGILRTDGSYSFEAFQDGKLLEINPEVGVYAYFPTDKVDPEMNLYQGNIIADNIKWTLTDTPQEGIPACDKSTMTRRECKRCERLMRLNKAIKPEKKPTGSYAMYQKRYYWENGTMYWAASGSAHPIFSKKSLEECQDYLARTEDGQELLAKVKDITENQLSDIGSHYAFRLGQMGWANVDKLEKSALMAFSGRVLGEDGAPLNSGKIHLYCKELNVHLMAPVEAGEYKLRFVPDVPFTLFSYSGQEVGAREMSLSQEDGGMNDLGLNEIKAEEMDSFLERII